METGWLVVRGSEFLVRRREVRSTRLVVRGERELWFVRSFVRRRRQRGGVGAFGCGSASAEETRAARIRGADGTQGKSLFLSFSFGFLVCVCVVRPRLAK